jgi:hypothetical protein
LDLRAFIGEENFKTIAVDNPKVYFKSKHKVKSKEPVQ